MFVGFVIALVVIGIGGLIYFAYRSEKDDRRYGRSRSTSSSSSSDSGSWFDFGSGGDCGGGGDGGGGD